MIEFLKEFINFILERKKFIFIPIIIFIILFAFLILMTKGSPIAPFIYSIF